MNTDAFYTESTWFILKGCKVRAHKWDHRDPIGSYPLWLLDRLIQSIGNRWLDHEDGSISFRIEEDQSPTFFVLPGDWIIEYEPGRLGRMDDAEFKRKYQPSS